MQSEKGIDETAESGRAGQAGTRESRTIGHLTHKQFS